MRSFSYFLYENFDPGLEKDHPGNPRRILDAGADGLLSRVADFAPGTCPAGRMREAFGGEAVARLTAAGALREEKGVLAFDTPVFLEEDASVLRDFSARTAAALADRLWEIREKLWTAVGAVRNGFDERRNLYHVLCGMVFDGLFFDWLDRGGAVAVSRVHPGGLDYLSVIYEDCRALRAFSDGLLCSYNRLTDGKTALESFGDADGDRFDLYRCFRLRERGALPERFEAAGRLLDALPRGEEKGLLLTEVRSLLAGQGCREDCAAVLDLFGYTEGGRVCVPVFSQEDEAAVAHVAALVEEALYGPVERTLAEAREGLDLTAVRHGVPRGEIANELYHVLFGGINEEVVRRGLAAAPPYRTGEGRFLRCIEC